MHKKYHIVYKTTNLINGKCYVGVHSTNKKKDGYIGSGTALKHAIAKYGIDNFKKEILHVFDTREDAIGKEKEIVDNDFVKRKDTYNLMKGGSGSKETNHGNFDKLREKIIRRNKKKFKCKHCGGLFGRMNLKRWHGDNCTKHPKGGYRHMAYDGPPEQPPKYIDGSNKRMTKRRCDYLEKIRAFYGIDFGL